MLAERASAIQIAAINQTFCVTDQVARGLSRRELARFKFDKRSQLFVGVHNERVPTVAVCVSNSDCLPLGING
jgi:hypothetical protein